MITNGRKMLQHLSNDDVAEKQKRLDARVEELQRQTLTESLAQSFPAWDLNPPAVLIRRRSSRFQ